MMFFLFCHRTLLIYRRLFNLKRSGSLDESQLLPDDEPLVDVVSLFDELAPDKGVHHACNTLVIALLGPGQSQHSRSGFVRQALAVFLQFKITTNHEF